MHAPTGHFAPPVRLRPCTPHLAGYVLKCMLSPDVRQLATTSSDKTVKLWNLDGFTLDRTLAGGRCWARSSALMLRTCTS